MNPNFRPRYMLSERELSTLSHQLLHHRPPRMAEQLVCYMLDGRDIFSNLARHIEREVFFDKFSLDNEDMHRMYSKYEHEPHASTTECASIFFLVMDQSNPAQPVPVGAIRIIRYPKPTNPSSGAESTTGQSDAGLATLNDAASMLGISSDAFQTFHNIPDLRKVADVASIVIPQRYRIHRNTPSSSAYLISSILLRAVLLWSTHEGMTHLVTTLDVAARRIMIDTIGWPLVPLMHEPDALPPGTAWQRLDSASLHHEGSDDSMFLVMTLDDRFVWAPELRLRSLVDEMYTADGELKEAGSEKQKSLAVSVKRSVVVARRMVWGENIDHRLMFDYSLSPYGRQRQSTQRHVSEMARL